MKTLLIVLGVIILVGVLGIAGTALNLITIPWLKFTSQVQTNRDIVTKTYNADNALYNYHWFQERLQALKALEVNIQASKDAIAVFEANAGPRKDWTFEDKTEDARLRAVFQGQNAQYQNLAAEYNAKAGEADRSIFKDELPLFFSIKPY